MRDIKTEQSLAGDEYWPIIPMVTVSGDSKASAIPVDATQPEGEKVIQTWQRVAVLEVTPAAQVYLGFVAGDHMQFMNVLVELVDGKFGVRVGDGQVKFFIIPQDLKSRLELKLVEVTDMSNEKYSTLPVY
jgi:hypothetical protein